MGAAISICGKKDDVDTTTLISVLPVDRPVEDDEDSDLSSDTTSSWESDDEEAYECAWETIDEIFESAASILESQGWKRTVLGQAQKNLEDALNELSREEREALEAEAIAQKEREEYEEALRVLEKEREEMEAAEVAARKELEEAEEAEALALKEREEAEEAERIAAQEVLEAEEAEEAFDKEREEAEEAEAHAARLEEAASAARRAAEDASSLAERAILKDKAIAEAQRLHAEAEEAEAAAAAARVEADRERAEADAALEVARKERAEADAAIAAAEKERMEAEEAEREAARERREAEEAIREAARERREYEEAMQVMEKEKAEAEAAQRRAEKERAEAIEARSKFEERQALLRVSECISASKAAHDIVQRSVRVIPDDHATLHAAVQALRGAGDGSGRVLVRRGRHDVGDDGDDGEVEVAGAVEIEGEEGAVLLGSLILAPGSSGTLRHIHVENQFGACVWALGGRWSVERCQLLCGSTSKPALLGTGDSRLHVTKCHVGGIGGKRVCRTGVSAQARAAVAVQDCQLRECGNSTAALQHQATLSLTNCTLTKAPYALRAKDGDSASLSVQTSNISCDQVWDGQSRPGSVSDFGNRVLFYTSRAEGTTIADHSLCSADQR